MFTADALKAYSAWISREAPAQEVQGVLGLMALANLLMRVKHGHYEVTDSFVEKAWGTRLQAGTLLKPGASTDLAASD